MKTSIRLNPINVVRLNGGLGNQMFQYSFGKALEYSTGLATKFDAALFLNPGVAEQGTFREFALGALRTKITLASQNELGLFGTQHARGSNLWQGIVDRAVGKYRKTRQVDELSFSYDEKMLGKTGRGRYFAGYWQTPRYFEGIKDQIISDFQPSAALSGEALELKEKIASTQSACIHVRRGDYANDLKTNSFHGLMGVDYYKSALAILRTRGDFENVFVFSDEPEWCVANLELKGNVQVVSASLSGPHATHHLHLMSCGSGFVIPNSSFGWWGAWLSAQENTEVVSPKSWFADPRIDTSDLIPKNWQRV